MSLISSWYLLFRQKFRSIYRFKWQLTDFTFKEKLSSNINNVFCEERKCHKWEVFLLQMTNVPFCPIEKKQSLVKTIRYTLGIQLLWYQCVIDCGATRSLCLSCEQMPIQSRVFLLEHQFFVQLFLLSEICFLFRSGIDDSCTKSILWFAFYLAAKIWSKSDKS